MALWKFKDNELVKVAGNYGSIPDAVLSETSANPIQNKTVTVEINSLKNSKADRSELTAINEELDKKVDAVEGKSLTDVNFTGAYENKLINIEAGANKTIVDSALSTESLNPLQNKIVTTEINTLKNNKLEASVFTTFKNEVTEDLKDFYTKSDVYTKDEIDQRISSIPKLSISVVDALPTENISNETIYLLKINGGEEDRNLYYEYIYVNNKWENLGKQEVDLSGFLTTESFNTQIANYYNKTQVDTELAKYLPLTGGKLTGDLEIEATDPTLKLNSAEITANGFANLSIYSPYNVVVSSGAKNITLSETDAVLKPTSGLSLGSSTNSWLNIYGSTIYQGGKQVANADDVLPLSAGSGKALTADLYIDNGGTDKSVVFSSGARIRGNGSGALILSAKDGYGIYFNPKGNTNSDEGIAIIGGAMNPRITDNVYLGTQSLQWKQIHGKEIYEGGERVVIQPTLNGYLPLTAGADKKLTGDLYFDTSSADRKIDFSGGSVIKGNSAGSLILSSKTGMPVYITANGESLSGNKNVIEIYSTAFAPRTTDLMYMGTSSNKWKGIYGVKTYANEAYEYDTDGTTLRRLATKLYVDNSVAPKLDRVDGSTTTQAYGVGSAGQQTMFQITQGVTTNALVRRNGTQIKVDETPVEDNDATSKKYVDETVATIETNINTELENYVPKKSGNGLYTQSSDGSVYIKGMGQNEPGTNQVILWTANRTVRSAAPIDDNDLVNLAYANSNYLSSGTKYGSSFDLSLDPDNYKLSVTLKDQDGTSLSTKEVDLPLESIILSAEYKDSYTHNGTTYTKVIVISLSTTDSPVIIPVADLVSGLQSEITSTNKLSVNLISGLSTIATSGKLADATADSTHRLVTDEQITNWNKGYGRVFEEYSTSDMTLLEGAHPGDICVVNGKRSFILSKAPGTEVSNWIELQSAELDRDIDYIYNLSTELMGSEYILKAMKYVKNPAEGTPNQQGSILMHIVDSLTSDSRQDPLAAQQGKVLKGLVDDLDSTRAKLDATNLSATNVSSWKTKLGVPTKTSDLTNDSDFLTSFTETDPTVPNWAKAATKPTYKFSEITEKPEFATIATSGKLADATEDDTHVTITAAEKTRLSTLTNYNDSEIRNLLDGKADSDSYLPLTAGEEKPLTGSLYITSDESSVWGQGIEFTGGPHIGSTGPNMGIRTGTYLYFRVGDSTKIRLSSTQFQPSSNNTMSLGSSGTQWLNMYAKNIYKDRKEVATLEDVGAVEAKIPTIPENIAYTNAANIFSPIQTFASGASISESSLYAVIGADEKTSADVSILSVPDGVTLEIGNDASELTKINLKNTVQAPSFTDGTITKTMTEILTGAGVSGGGTKIKWRKW